MLKSSLETWGRLLLYRPVAEIIDSTFWCVFWLGGVKKVGSIFSVMDGIQREETPAI